MFSPKTTIASFIFYFISVTSNAQILTCIDAVDLTKPKKNVEQGAFMINYKWTPGAVLNVCFIDGSAWQHEEVKKYAPIWSEYANIKFNFLLAYNSGAEIRISFKADLGSCSQIGTIAKTIAPGEWTMNYGWTPGIGYSRSRAPNTTHSTKRCRGQAVATTSTDSSRSPTHPDPKPQPRSVLRTAPGSAPS